MRLLARVVDGILLSLMTGFVILPLVDPTLLEDYTTWITTADPASALDVPEGENPLHALVLENDHVRLAIVAMDVAGITRGILEDIQATVLELTGIPASHLLVNSTHNHTTPDFINAIPEELETYAKHFADVVAGTVLEASSHMSPATAGYGWGDLTGMTINRQYKERSIDTAVGVLRVDHAIQKP